MHLVNMIAVFHNVLTDITISVLYPHDNNNIITGIFMAIPFELCI